MRNETIDALSATGSKVTVAGAGLSGWGWVVSNEFFGAMGLLVALAGLLINLYYKRKADARIEREALLRIQERQMRIDLMHATQQPAFPPHESGYGHLSDDQ